MTIKEKIICHINYRDVFNAPVSKYSLQNWLGFKNDTENQITFNKTLLELKKEGLIIEKDGYLAVTGKEHTILNQKFKSRFSKKLIKKGNKELRFLWKVPFIKFVGISGSVAADNPTLGNDKSVDLDLFVICATKTLWIMVLIERVLRNCIILFKGKHFYCFNYVTEESFMEVFNKNFFTASELVNLIPIIDKGIYGEFIKANRWYRNYYQTEKIKISIPTSNKYKTHSFSKILWPINYAFFIIFCLTRALKRLELKPALELLSTFKPEQKCNLQRLSNPHGGYQELIKIKFDELLRLNFPSYYSQEITRFLFPKESMFGFDISNIHDKEHLELFEKYKRRYVQSTI